MAVSGENYVAPIHIEDEILREVPFLSNVCVVGQGHPHLTCLVTVKVLIMNNLDITVEPG